MEANADEHVDGIMVYFPVFGGGQDLYIQQVISREKDVEGLCHFWVQNMYHNIRYIDPPANRKKSILPCTPLAIVKILEYLQVYNPILDYGNRLYGKTIVVINRSEVVGRPLAALLANDGAKVYSVDITGVQLFTRGQGIRLKRHEVMRRIHNELLTRNRSPTPISSKTMCCLWLMWSFLACRPPRTRSRPSCYVMAYAVSIFLQRRTLTRTQ